MIVEVRDDTLALSGNLRRNEWPLLESAVALLLRRHPEGLILDCTELRTLNALGAETLREAEAQLMASGARLVVAGLRPEVSQVLRTIPNLSSHLPLAETVAAARTSLGLAPSAPAEILSANAIVLLGSSADLAALGAVAQLTPPGGTILILYPLTIPRDRSLLSPLGEEEEHARAVMERFRAALRAQGFQTTERFERTRDRAQRILALLAELQVQRLVLAVAPDAEETQLTTARQLVQEAPCATLLLRLPVGGAA